MAKTLFAVHVLLIVVYVLPAYAAQPFADSLRISLEQAESSFFAHNLLLLAKKADIGESNANIMQASLLDNPGLSIEQNIYNQETHKYFPTGHDGQIAFAIQQLIDIAGKRGRRVSLETTHCEMTQDEYDDLVRTLLFELHTTFYDLHFLQQTMRVYEHEILQMHTTVQLLEAQYEKGNIAQKDVIRLKAFLLTLDSERKEMSSQINEKAGNLALLTGDTTNAYIIPQVDVRALDTLTIPLVDLNGLLDSAYAHRQDLKAREAAVRAEEQNLALQRASAWPDVRLGFLYDRNASYIPDYTALTLEFDLPIFNRNQGAIEAAEYRVESSRKELEHYKKSVEHEVRQALLRVRESQQLYKTFDSQFAVDFNGMMEGITQTFEKRNMSLVEFVDFYESYKNSVVQLNQLQSDRLRALEELNLAAGITMFGR